ncbi:MAG: trans-2-enoyl-CoA reductase family protein [Lachnospiraceae bacterium]|nr:trans-2-enoyl-CoA reductase family protein [Lachnospiraceae bacterium]MDD3614607.1 trans-2-enoyl-CoA reductase family protein [Lachnospiraceae bacterium]
MIVEPKVREYICTTAHPQGCEESIKRQIEVVEKQGTMEGPKRVLVIGCSTGYGLASRITSAFGCKAATIGIMFERPSNGKRTATPGWYNTVAFEKNAEKEGLYAKTINGDAFSKEVKDQTIELIKKDLGTVDMVIYSLAAPRRTMPDGSVASSCLRTTGEAFTEKNLDLRNNEVNTKTVEPATDEELDGTIKVMGGGDWKDWIAALSEAGVLAEETVTVAYSYIGPKLTYPIYYNGTIGMAKRDLHQAAKDITAEFKTRGVQAYVSVNKALVTQASAAIPVVPLYFAILYKVMKEHGTHEGCIQQISRLFHDKLLKEQPITDNEGLIRMDDWEQDETIQKEVMDIWAKVDTDNVKQLADVDGYWEDFYHMFGFHYENLDYTKDVDVEVSIPSIQ